MSRWMSASLLVAILPASIAAAAELAPPFDAVHDVIDLGAAPAAPSNYGGVCFLDGDPDVLLLAVRAGTGLGAIYDVPLLRDRDGRIVGFAGAATFRAAAPGLDGGGVGGSLNYFLTGYGNPLAYMTVPDNCLGQILEDGTGPYQLESMDAWLPEGIGAHRQVPPGFPNEGAVKLVTSDPGAWYDAAYFITEASTYILAVLDPAVASMPPDVRAIEYVAGAHPGFGGEPALLATVGSADRIDGWRIDANGDVIAATQFPFLSDLPGVTGLACDPTTNDLVVTTSSRAGGADAILLIAVRCAVDVTGDDVVDVADLVAVILAWGPCASPCAADVNDDGAVDVTDLVAVILGWGACPTSTG